MDGLRTLETLRRAGPADLAGRHVRLEETKRFGSNPGQLRMFSHMARPAVNHSALVVVLHGCGQTAAGYDHGAGWSTLADRYGFALLVPEQQRSNNPNGCFNWFQPEDAQRGRGEAASIRQMVEHMVREKGVDPSRVFVTGLSAGGAMTSVMLACYPDVFAAGAIIAGLAVWRRLKRATGVRKHVPVPVTPGPALGRPGARGCPATSWADGLACRSGTAMPTKPSSPPTPVRSSSNGPRCMDCRLSRRRKPRSTAIPDRSGPAWPART